MVRFADAIELVENMGQLRKRNPRALVLHRQNDAILHDPGGNEYLRRTEVAGEIYAAAHNSLWHDDYQASLLSPMVWNHFAYRLTVGRYFREACGIYDLIGDDWVRTVPWRSVERFVELRDRARDEADDPAPDED